MWWRRHKSTTVQIPTTSTTTSSSPSATFSCSSFKDIQTLFQDEIPTNLIFRRRLNLLRPTLPLPAPPDSERRVVVYFTSLRVVRSTFEDCKAVRSILRGIRVEMDERDLSMDSRFVRELQGIMLKTEMKLPSVFISGRYIGGADEVMLLHESGELKKLMEGMPAADSDLCDVCEGHRFVLCDVCDGSHKMYTLKGGFKTCTACNENGLTSDGPTESSEHQTGSEGHVDDNLLLCQFLVIPNRNQVALTHPPNPTRDVQEQNPGHDELSPVPLVSVHDQMGQPVRPAQKT
ncbi:hypothetical protein K1719_028108 [Acacia pycnantha]|nr:hypothetical protein K1719_028108 [Acacia pycnantha]